MLSTRDGRPVPRGTLPAGKGGFPAPPRAVGRGGFPPRPVKMIKTAGKLRGKIKARISTYWNDTYYVENISFVKGSHFLTVLIKVGARCNQGSESESFEVLPLLLKCRMGEGAGEDDDFVVDDDDGDGDGDVVCERSAITANARWENNQLMWTAFLATLIPEIKDESPPLQIRGYQNVF